MVLPLLDDDPLAEDLRERVGAGRVEARYIPLADGESRILIEGDVRDRPILILASLDRPDVKFLRLAFLTDLLRELGAHPIVLVAPYLPYRGLRAPRSPAEVVIESTFGSLVSAVVDAVVTVGACGDAAYGLPEAYHVATREGPIAPAIGAWIAAHVHDAILVARSPDERAWLRDVARHSGSPVLALGQAPMGPPSRRTPVLIADVLAPDAGTLETLERLRSAELPAPVGIAVHALFGPTDASALLAAGFARLSTTNTIRHQSNAIDVGPILAGVVQELLA